VINEKQLFKLIIKVCNKFKLNKLTLIKTLYDMGSSKHSLMVLELLFLSKSFNNIKTILLLTDDTFICTITELYDNLKCFKSKHKKLQDSKKLLELSK